MHKKLLDMHCIYANAMSGKVKGKVKIILKGDKPFYCVHVDHIDIFDKHVKLKKPISVVIYAFPKFVKLYSRSFRIFYKNLIFSIINLLLSHPELMAR